MVQTDPELKGEHFSKNNPDMKLDFPKPSYEEIQAMERKEGVRGFPITCMDNIKGTVVPPMALDNGLGEIVTESGPMWNVKYLEEMKRHPPSEMDPEA